MGICYVMQRLPAAASHWARGTKGGVDVTRARRELPGGNSARAEVLLGESRAQDPGLPGGNWSQGGGPPTGSWNNGGDVASSGDAT